MCWNYGADFDIFLTSYQLLLWFFIVTYWPATGCLHNSNAEGLSEGRVDQNVSLHKHLNINKSTKFNMTSQINAHPWIPGKCIPTTNPNSHHYMYNLFLWKQVYKKGEILKYTIHVLTLQVNKQIKGFYTQMPFFTKYRNDNKEHKLIDDQNAFWFKLHNAKIYYMISVKFGPHNSPFSKCFRYPVC